MSEPFLHVLYASQTGCAQSVAEDFGRLVAQVCAPSCIGFWVKRSQFIAQRLGLDVPVLSMDEFNMPMLPSLARVVFFVSTTGQGGAPDNMKKSWSILIRKELPSNSLSATHVAVFGLGDSSYAKFNFPSKKLHARLLQLGAQPMLPLGLGDDQHVAGHHTALVPWQAALIKILAGAADIAGVPTQARQLSVVANYNILPVAALGTAGIIITFLLPRLNEGNDHAVPSTSVSDEYLDVAAVTDIGVCGMSLVAVVENKVLSQGEEREVRHLEFEWSGAVYQPGDVVVVQPQMPARDRCTISSRGRKPFFCQLIHVAASRCSQ